jgi:hypothetical protein
LYDLNVQQYCCAGLNFGYYYDQSPVMVYDGDKAPEYSMGSFTASTVPGCRVPHFWLGEGQSVYDALGPAYTLLCLKPEHDDALEALQAAAERQGMPLRVLDVSGVKDLPLEYQHPLLMVRADAHTVWRGHRLDDASAHALVATLCGLGSLTPA